MAEEMMNFLSVCSGIEAASVAFTPLGWRAVAFSEIEPFPCAVLAHHYPDVPNWGDMTKFKEWPDASIDLLCGGTPCQSFSVAGLRKGLDDPRGNLMLTFGAIAGRYRPRWLVWENVPGVLSSNGGRDFGSFLGMLGQLGYGFAYRVLDAQYFGVAQRRRRVFVVGYLGDWRRAAAVLFERHSLSGNPAPSREARKDVAPTLSACAHGGGGPGTDFDPDGSMIHLPAGTDTFNGTITGDVAATLGAQSGDGVSSGPSVLQAFGGNNQSGSIEVATALNVCASASGRMDFESESFVVAHSLRGEGFDASEDGTGRGTPLVPVAFDTTQITSAANYSNPRPGDPCHPLAAGAHAPAIAFDSRQDPVSSEHLFGAIGSSSPQSQAVAYAIQSGALRENPNSGPDGVGVQADNAYTLEARAEVQVVATQTASVRRLTPEECEALQAFPSVIEKVRFDVCCDHQKRDVRVALKCHKLPRSVSRAEESGSLRFVSTAAKNSSTDQAPLAPLVDLSVLTRSEAKLQALRIRGKLIWSASTADASGKYLPSTLHGNTAQELAKALQIVVKTIGLGKAASLPDIRLSLQGKSGNQSVEKYGPETGVNAKNAEFARIAGRFTISDLGRATPILDSTAATLFCSVMTAISGFIPNETLPSNFSVEFSVETPYTRIPWRGHPADQCPDGPRYKALGNSWCVKVARWVGERIEQVESLEVA